MPRKRKITIVQRDKALDNPRTENIHFRVTPDEHEELRSDAATHHGGNVSALLMDAWRYCYRGPRRVKITSK